jgi:hypothetical protein
LRRDEREVREGAAINYFFLASFQLDHIFVRGEKKYSFTQEAVLTLFVTA